MTARVWLLGPPRVERDGQALAPPRGSKAWALLAYLVLTGAPVPRVRLAELLFGEAEDPPAALRWSLSQLRRTLTGAAGVGGDPLRLELRSGTVVDVAVLEEGPWPVALALPTFGSVLLEDVHPRVGAAFDLWLSGERRRIAGRTAALLQEAAHERLAHGDAVSAADLAGRLVAADPWDESHHELLVRALVGRGDRGAAAEQVMACRDLFRRELGREPGPSVAAALAGSPTPADPTTRASLEVAIDGGVGAAHTGAYERAIELLRPAVDGARALGDPALLARALTELGTVLVHGVRGRDEEGIALLHEAVVLAERVGARPTAAAAARELGHVELLRAHHPQMEGWFSRAAALADGDEPILAWVDVYAGLGRVDRGDYLRGAAALHRAVRRADAADDPRAAAFALASLGRLHLLREDYPAARTALDAACALTRSIGWSSFLPFPGALRAELALADGDLPAAQDGLDRAYALARQVGDPCWEAYSLRGRGLLAAARGDDEGALELLVAAPAACRRLPDTHAWVVGHCLDALCGFAVARGLPGAATWVAELADFAAQRGLRELTARAAVHRMRLGQPGAGALVDATLSGIDNPALGRLART